MERARIANRLAKMVNGQARDQAYRVKTAALVTLSERFPERVNLSYDPETPAYLIVRVAETQFGLHAPVSKFNLRKDTPCATL
jgi:hypothetical protein